MKRIIFMVLVLLFMTTHVFAASNLPDFLTQEYNNYTANYSIKMTFDNAHEIVALFEELEMPEEITYYVDVKALLQSLLSYDRKVFLQADISENYDKIKLAVTTDEFQNVVINSNLNIDIKAKTGIWLDIDLSNEEKPVFDMIYTYPFLNKYLKITAEDVLTEETLKEFKTVLNKENVDKIREVSMDIFVKYAKIQGYGNKYSVSFDNSSFTAYINELLENPVINGIINGNENAIVSNDNVVDLMTNTEQYPSIKDCKILGKDGLKSVYTLSGGRIVSQEIKADISIDLAHMYTLFVGEKWPFEAPGKVDFTMDVKCDYTKISTTKVEYPVLTEENSFSIKDLMPDEDVDDDVDVEIDETPKYPIWYISESSDVLPIIDGEIYVPLRKTLEAAYGDSVTIEFNNGVITATSDYFPDFKELTLTIGSDKVYAGDKEYAVGNVILVDDTTFVSNKLLCDVFGWKLTYVSHDLLTNLYYYSFVTNSEFF